MKYTNQVIKFDVDLVFKEIVSIKALGMEIQSKKSIHSLRTLLKNLLDDIEKIKLFHQNELEKLGLDDLN